jgi:hypothetical protein
LVSQAICCSSALARVLLLVRGGLPRGVVVYCAYAMADSDNWSVDQVSEFVESIGFPQYKVRLAATHTARLRHLFRRTALSRRCPPMARAAWLWREELRPAPH